MEPTGDAVKKRATPANQPPGRGGFARYSEGWELGALVVGLVLAAALLAVPRATAPGLFPVPLIDVAETRAARATLEALARRAEQRPLPFETRAVGDGFRKLGLALSPRGGDLEHALGALRERVLIARRAGQDSALLELRAVQARLFLQAARAHEGQKGAEPAAELHALGGDFAERALQNRWLVDGRYRASDDELLTSFTLRWSELTGLSAARGFAPSLGELRRYYRFLLLYPERSAEPGAERSALASARLRYVQALAKRDPEYPAELARGSLLGQLGMPEPGAAALREHLARRPGGEWTLRAKNQLLALTPGIADEPAE